MIVGLGIDLVEHRRIARELAKREWLEEDGIFSADEIRQCSNARHPELRYARCFAAKEATLKALGIRIQDLGLFREVEVTVGERAKITIRLGARLRKEFERLQATRITACVGSTAATTAAMVVLEA